MEKRQIGTSGLEIAPLVFGGNVFGWTADAPTSYRLLDMFVDGGFNCIDTADKYSAWVPGNKGGESETIIGDWLAQGGRRDKVVIASKVGMVMGPGTGGLARGYIVRAVEDSLRRLRTDVIDLYQAHCDDPDVPMEETLAAFDALIQSGKVRAIGASNFTPDRLAQALDLSDGGGLPRYQSLQPWYNLYDRGAFEERLEALCLERGVGVINYYGLASGFLTGKYRTEADLEGSARAGRVGAYIGPRGTAIVDSLEAVAAELSASPAQVALAWLMQRPAITAPIASASKPDQLKELMGAVDMKLNAGQVAVLDAVSAQRPGTPPGER